MIPNSPYRYSGPPPAQEGDRIELRRLGDQSDRSFLPRGTCGTVVRVEKIDRPHKVTEWQLGVHWDNGRTVALNYPRDTFRRISV